LHQKQLWFIVFGIMMAAPTQNLALSAVVSRSQNASSLSPNPDS
jgi:hypothetical protein